MHQLVIRPILGIINLRIVIMMCLLSFLPTILRANELRRGLFFVEVRGETLLINSESTNSNRNCILGSGTDDVLARLMKIPRDHQVILNYEIMNRPIFVAPPRNTQPPDSMGEIRGQLIAPWCNSNELYWVNSFTEFRRN